MYVVIFQVDATQLEINPLVETDDGRVIAVDAKINFDDHAKFRQQEIFALDDVSETDPREVSNELLDNMFVKMSLTNFNYITDL